MKNLNVANSILNMVIAALLCALGITIPMFMPLKLVMEPASFTLASHVPVFIAVFISPVTAVAVAVCTGIGFFFSTTPVIALRALSHVVFAFIGAVILKKKPELLSSPVQTLVFGFVLGVIHGICEVIVVTWFYFGNSMSEAYYTTGFFKSVILLVGVGTVIHSLVDFILAVIVWKPVSKVIHFPVSARA